jgi:DNA-binding Xre family transcriptional regulator
MSGTHELIDALRIQLKTRGFRYADVARGLRMSEASVKRLFASRNCSLKRLDQICQWLEIDFAELARGLKLEDKLISQLTLAQEKEIVSDKKLLLMAICTMNHYTVGDIMRDYMMTLVECTQLLVKLDRIGFIDLLPNNVYRLKVARSFKWLPDGPIHRFFRSLSADFFNHPFTALDECFIQLNLMLTPASVEALKRRLQLVAQDYAEQHNEDARTARDARNTVSIIMALRPWHPEFIRAVEKTGQ